MKKLTFLLIMGVFVMLLWVSCSDAPNPVQPSFADNNGVSGPAKAEQIKTRETETFPFSYFDECTGEVVSFNVEVTTTTFINFDANGSFHGHFLQQWHCTGVGETSGIKYVGPQTDHSNAFEGVNGCYTAIYTENWVVNSQGGADNLLGHVLALITITPNGKVTTEILNMSFECKG